MKNQTREVIQLLTDKFSTETTDRNLQFKVVLTNAEKEVSNLQASYKQTFKAFTLERKTQFEGLKKAMDRATGDLENEKKYF